MTDAVRAFVRQRAGNRCEYCQLHQDDSPLASLHVEHIRPRKHGGTDQEENLCLACIDCNLHKGPNLTGIDPASGEITELFHPRKQSWHDHFAWHGIFLIGKTTEGRTTIRVMNINSEEQLELRASC
jgi:5-methylcytosine-specific restriction endonuclease McrA